MVSQQIQAIFEDLPVAAVKTGMLANAGIIAAVARALARARQHSPALKLVVDPVMVSTSNARLLDDSAVAAFTERLLPLADLITPNLPEAAALARLPQTETPERLARALLAQGARAVLVKGGHGNQEVSTDWLISASTERQWAWPRVPGRFHGTGCCLSAGITAGLALGLALEPAIDQAARRLQWWIGHAGHGHLGTIGLLPIERGPAP